MITTTIEKIKEKLKRKLDFINNRQEHDFWLEIKEYLTLLEQNSLLLGITKILRIQFEQKNNELEEIEKQAIKELDKIKNDLEKFLSGKGIKIESTNPLIGTFAQYDSIKKGNTIVAGSPLVFALEGVLVEIINFLNKTHPEIKLSKWCNLNSRGNIVDFKSVSSLNLYKNTVEKNELDLRTSVSQAYAELEKVRIIYNLIASGFNENYLNELEQKYRGMYSLDWRYLANEFNELIKKNGGRELILGKKTAGYFKKQDFEQHILRLHNYILDTLEFGHLGLSLLTRFKQRVEWYQRNEYLAICQKKQKKKQNKRDNETKLTDRLGNFLFDSGVFPVSQAIFGIGKPDVVGSHPAEIIVIEVKLFEKLDNSYLSKGLNQIFNYMSTLDQNFGYLVLFNLTNLSMVIEDHLVLKDKTIFITVVNLNEAPSKSKMKVWNVSKLEELVKA